MGPDRGGQAMRTLVSILALVLCLSACAGDTPDDPNAPDAGTSGGSVLTTEQLEALRELSCASSPAPPLDVSHHVADDPTAAAWGQVLFFDTGFSGRLLDSDNGRPDDTVG